MTARRITAHKGGRTARAPEARIRPQTLQRIQATMREREASFADLLEEEYGGNMNGNWCVAIFDRDEHGEFHRATIDGLPSKKACIAEAQTWANKTRYEITNPQGKVTSIDV